MTVSLGPVSNDEKISFLSLLFLGGGGGLLLIRKDLIPPLRFHHICRPQTSLFVTFQAAVCFTSTHLADYQHLCYSFAAHVSSCDDVILMARVPSSHRFSCCQGYVFSAPYKVFGGSITNRQRWTLYHLTKQDRRENFYEVNQMQETEGR